jgi:hypothetical protein
MADSQNLSLYQQQKLTKPLVESVIPDILDGEARENALDFVAHLRKNKIKPAWVLSNQWKAMFKGRCICKIVMRQDCWKNDDYFIVAAWLENINQYEHKIISEGLEQLVWDNVYYCVHKPAGSPAGNKIQHALTYPCNIWGCAPGKDITLCGKELTNICRNGNRQHFWFHNPDKATLDGIKKLLQFEQEVRLESARK